ncbi:MAG: hypothetical protein GVY08_04105 [Bacteroidetes bacterium]|jgi:hypothetical protein|nr:hypothetical protein [Bacteroidota bacterium]
MKRSLKVVWTALLIFCITATAVFAGGESLTAGPLHDLRFIIDQYGPFGNNMVSVLLTFFSLWLLIVGLMCYRLEKIPGIPQTVRSKPYDYARQTAAEWDESL